MAANHIAMAYIAFALYFLITAAPKHPDWSQLAKWQARVAKQWQPRYKAYRHDLVYSSDPGYGVMQRMLILCMSFR